MKRVRQCVSDLAGWDAMAVTDDPVDQIEPLSAGIDEDLVAEFSTRLAVVWEFLAKGRTSDSRAHRVWAALYVMRRDLIDGESVEAYAGRKGVSVAGVHRYVAEFRQVFAGELNKESFMRRAGRAGSASRQASTRK